MRIYRCSCGEVATHMVTITVAPVGAPVPAARNPGQTADVRSGYYAPHHVVPLAEMAREYGKIGLDVADYRITELFG